MSELSPLDILGKKFAIKFRGYPANEVHEYLTEIAGAMEGLMRAKAGDWLVVGIHGEMYAIDREIFEKTYDLV